MSIYKYVYINIYIYIYIIELTVGEHNSDLTTATRCELSYGHMYVMDKQYTIGWYGLALGASANSCTIYCYRVF